jgi:outer membrane receptor protein involved in Fe transport
VIAAGGRVALLCGVLAATGARAENPAEVLELPQVRVIGTTPLPGSGLDMRQVPANVQVYTGRDLKGQAGEGVADFLGRNAGGVGLNSAQGNRWQPDVNVRGFAASPLLGTPQGVSVFVDGVRVNEPFGDSVNWDLIPASAIASLQMIPGSNPAFGLNTLGGAVAVYTKSGASTYPDRPGADAVVTLGSHGRRTASVETGGRAAVWDWFATAAGSVDNGWAAHNASRVNQLFAKVGRQDDSTDLDITFSAADNHLEGSQTVPASFPDPREPYTWPDVNTNRLAFLTVKGSIALGDDWLLGGNLYVRHYRNGNVSSNAADADAGTIPDPQATLDSAAIDQLGRGAGVQLTRSARLLGRTNQLVLGASVDHGRVRFSRSTADARFTADRGTVAIGPSLQDTDVDSGTRHVGVFFSDALGLDDRWTLTLSGRYNRSDVGIADRSGTDPALDGSHRFSRFNPAVGLTFSPSARFTAYAAYNEGTRAPTAIELTCADPNAPCKLPNAFIADPPLRQVVARTFEIGARGRFAEEGSWSAALFRTDLHDDLQFIASGGAGSNAGYFTNVGATRRQGLELAAKARVARPLTVSARLDLLDATYRSSFVAHSPSNASADADGNIVVSPGNRIPGLPERMLKVRAELEAPGGWLFTAQGLAASAVRARGDENNLDTRGRVAGYARLDLEGRWRATPKIEAWLRIDNALDRRYANFATLGRNLFTGPGLSYDPTHARDEPFYGYGAPRSVVVGLEVRFD